MTRKIVELDELLAVRRRCREQGRIVVWTNGCFDLLHVGHLRSLKSARARGDVLMVGINSDASVRALKGPQRPVIPQQERAELVAGLECVDYIIVFDDLTPERLLSVVKPDVHCKGKEYAPPGGRPIPEARVVLSYGGRIEFFDLTPAVSTSAIEARIRAARGGDPTGSGVRR